MKTFEKFYFFTDVFPKKQETSNADFNITQKYKQRILLLKYSGKTGYLMQKFCFAKILYMSPLFKRSDNVKKPNMERYLKLKLNLKV